MGLVFIVVSYSCSYWSLRLSFIRRQKTDTFQHNLNSEVVALDKLYAFRLVICSSSANNVSITIATPLFERSFQAEETGSHFFDVLNTPSIVNTSILQSIAYCTVVEVNKINQRALEVLILSLQWRCGL